MSAYLTREQLELVAEDGTTITVEAGDYLEAVDPFGAPLTLRQRSAWVSCLQRGAASGPPGDAVVVLEVRGKYGFARLSDLLAVDD